ERELAARTGDLAQQRSRDAAGTRRAADGRDGPLPFQATEHAQAVAREQEALQQRIQELSRAVEEITRAAQAAGMGDTAFQARLREVQELLQRAVTPELAARLRELQEALARLDPEATRRALERLAEAQQQLKAQLERSEELFRRAAVEGALASLAADAEDLRRRQAEWNRDDAARRSGRRHPVAAGGSGGGDRRGGTPDPRGGGEARARVAAAGCGAGLCQATDGGGARPAGRSRPQRRRGGDPRRRRRRRAERHGPGARPEPQPSGGWEVGERVCRSSGAVGASGA